MATKLTKFDFSAPSNLTAAGEEKAAYPWEEWFDGDTWSLTWGEDFDPHPLMMERIIRTRATGRKARVRVRHLPLNGREGSNDPTGIIVMERVDIEGPEQEKRSKRAEQSRERRATKKAPAKVNGSAVARKKVPSKKAPART
jgi:hypothetical protein